MFLNLLNVNTRMQAEVLFMEVWSHFAEMAEDDTLAEVTAKDALEQLRTGANDVSLTVVNLVFPLSDMQVRV